MANEDGKQRKGALATFRELAIDSGVPYSSIRELVLEGHLPFVQLGNSKVKRVKWTDWDRYIAASTERAAQR
jgi:hypothetical protein